jgi:hypothetical protein
MPPSTQIQNTPKTARKDAYSKNVFANPNIYATKKIYKKLVVTKSGNGCARTKSACNTRTRRNAEGGNIAH